MPDSYEFLKAHYDRIQARDTPLDARQTLVDRCTDFLCKGGLFNPELMEKQKATQLILDCRDALKAHAS